MKNILENVQVGDWVCCDHAQPDLRCRQVVKRTPSRAWTNLREDPFRLDGTRYKSDPYPVRPATPEDLAAWEAAKASAKARQIDAEKRRRKNARKERIRDAAEDLLAACKALLHLAEAQAGVCFCVDTEGRGLGKCVQCEARAAIAKADKPTRHDDD